MTKKVKTAMEWISEAVGIAVTCAVVAAGIYGLLFVDLTGNGRLWDALRGVAQDAAASPRSTGREVVEIRRVPVRPPDLEAKAQNHMLLVPEVPDKEIEVAVLSQNQPAPQPVADAMTDAPADKTAGKDWRVHLQGEMRNFSVYGKGEQQSSAAMSAGASRSSAGASPVSAPTPAAAVSAYRTGIAAEARPGITDHVSNVSGGTSDGVRNFR
ncbi:MAG: hypothetical protein ACHQ51_14945 [Elusimicrobiota bacterium]